MADAHEAKNNWVTDYFRVHPAAQRARLKGGDLEISGILDASYQMKGTGADGAVKMRSSRKTYRCSAADAIALKDASGSRGTLVIGTEDYKISEIAVSGYSGVVWLA